MDELMKRASFKEIWNTLQDGEEGAQAGKGQQQQFNPRVQAMNNSAYAVSKNNPPPAVSSVSPDPYGAGPVSPVPPQMAKPMIYGMTSPMPPQSDYYGRTVHPAQMGGATVGGVVGVPGRFMGIPGNGVYDVNNRKHSRSPGPDYDRNGNDSPMSEKKERRLEKNREAAKECRRKKKEYVKCLEERVRTLEMRNLSLIAELKKLKSSIGIEYDNEEKEDEESNKKAKTEESGESDEGSQNNES
eukprot:Nk52_evm17s805 gene=Nk52_evmTU17s805